MTNPHNLPMEPDTIFVSPHMYEYLLRYPEVAEAAGMNVEALVIASEVPEPCACAGEFEPCQWCM